MKKLLLTLLLCSLTTFVVADDYTTNYRLQVPNAGDRNWRDIYYDTMVSIDSTMGIISGGVSVSSVTEGVAGPLVIAPTTGAVKVSIASADTSTDGYITSGQYTKINILSNDAVTSWTSPLAYAAKTASILQSSTSQNGYITSTNYNTWTSNRVSTDAILSSLAVGSVSNTEIGYLDGVSGAIQTQITNNDNELLDLTANRVSTDAVLNTLNINSAYSMPTIVGSPGWVLSVDSGGTAAVWGTIDAGALGGANAALSNLSSVAINESLISDTDNTDDLGSAGVEWKDLYVDGTANIDSLVADTADINAGTFDGVVGGTTPADGSFTDLIMDKIDGNTLIVSPTSAYDTITKAMAAAAANDTILVAEGTYAETVTFTQNNITLKAIGSATNTIISGSANNSTILFNTKTNCVLDGFTINQTTADANTDYCIYVNSAGITTIQNCVINVIFAVETEVTAYGVGIHCDTGGIIVRNNRITMSNLYTSGTRLYGVYTITTSDTCYVENNIITFDTACTQDNAIIRGSTNSVMHINNNILVGNSTTGILKGIEGQTAYIHGNDISAITTTGVCRGINIATLGYIYSNKIHAAATTDGDAEWLYNGGTAYVTGNIVTGDGGITAGTLYSAGNNINDALQAPDGSAASSGVGSIKMANASAADSAGFLKMAKEDGTVVYVPYFTDETP